MILDRMSIYFIVCVSFGILFPRLLAAAAMECSEKEALLRLIPSTVLQPTDCLMECTRMTYIRKLQLQDDRTIRLKDSTEGDLGEFCWSMELKCTTGESLQQAYVLLPVDISAVGHEMLEVKTTGPTATTLHVHKSPSTVTENCGLRYDVTQHFSTESTGSSFCIQVITQTNIQGDQVLKCPPYLVTFWQRNRNQSNQEGGG